MKRSVVLLSGGLDSATALALCLERNVDVEALTIHYGQQHEREVKAARDIAAHFGVNHIEANLDPALFGKSALTGNGIIPERHAESPDATYVPARNTVFLAVAAARAETVGAGSIVIGSNADDEGGYPDCRWEYIDAYRDVLQLGTVNHVWIHAPLLRMTKTDVLSEAIRLGVPVDFTWSCYRGGDEPCGRCGACESRLGAERMFAK